MTKYEIKRLDDKWSIKVKEKAGFKCEICGKRNRLQSHHVITRANRATRWILNNGFCLCAGDHTINNDSAHQDPKGFIEKAKEKRGDKWYQDLITLKNKVIKMTYNQINDYLNNN